MPAAIAPRAAAATAPAAAAAAASSSTKGLEKRRGKEQKPQTIMIPSFTNLPISARFEREDNNEMFFIILEKKLEHLDTSLRLQWLDEVETGHPVYLHGIQGVSKSHCLYYTAWQMSKDPKYRVAYIPDCGGITMAPFSNILKVREDLPFFFFFFGDSSIFRSFVFPSLSLGN